MMIAIIILLIAATMFTIGILGGVIINSRGQKQYNTTVINTLCDEVQELQAITNPEYTEEYHPTRYFDDKGNELATSEELVAYIAAKMQKSPGKTVTIEEVSRHPERLAFDCKVVEASIFERDFYKAPSDCYVDPLTLHVAQFNGKYYLAMNTHRELGEGNRDTRYIYFHKGQWQSCMDLNYSWFQDKNSRVNSWDTEEEAKNEATELYIAMKHYNVIK